MRNFKPKTFSLVALAIITLMFFNGCTKDKNLAGPDLNPIPQAPLTCEIDDIHIESGNPSRQITCAAHATGGSAPYQYSWNFGDSHSAADSSPTHTYISDGNYKVSMVVTDASGETCSKDTTITIGTSSPLTCNASADKTSGQAPLSVKFQCTGSGGAAPYQYHWTFGDGAASTLRSPTHTFTDVRSYNVQVVITDANGTTAQSTLTVTATNSVNELTCSISASPILGPAPLDVTFGGNASGGTPPYSYRWQFGDGGTSSHQNAGHIYQTAGNYTAQLTVTDANSNACQQTTGITVTQPQTALACQASANPTSGQAPLTVQFSCTATGGNQPYQYEWSFGDGNTSSVREPSHTYTNNGTFNTLITVRDASGTAVQRSMTISVSSATPALTCSATATPLSGVAPLAVSFSGNASGGTPAYSYHWQFGDGSTSTLKNPSHTYQTSGTYEATLTVTDAAAQSCQKSVTIAAFSPPAAPALAGPANVTVGLSFALTWSYNWPYLATTGEKIVLERSTTGPSSGFSQIAEILRGSGSQFLIVNPQAGTYYYRARVRVSIAGHLTWSSYSSVVTVRITAPVSKTRFENTGTYFIVSLKIDGVEQFVSSPQGLPAGYFYELELAPGTHTYEALFGYWNEYDVREYLYRTTGSYVQRSGVTETVTLPGPTINDLLTKFSSSGLWSAWIPGTIQKASYRFFANGTFKFYVGSDLQATGNYSYVSRNPTAWAVTFSDGSFQGVLYETFGYFVMYNGPNGAALQYFYEGS